MTPYQKFVKQHRLAGRSMGEIGKLWSGKSRKPKSRRIRRISNRPIGDYKTAKGRVARPAIPAGSTAEILAGLSRRVDELKKKLPASAASKSGWRRIARPSIPVKKKRTKRLKKGAAKVARTKKKVAQKRRAPKRANVERSNAYNPLWRSRVSGMYQGSGRWGGKQLRRVRGGPGWRNNPIMLAENAKKKRRKKRRNPMDAKGVIARLQSFVSPQTLKDAGLNVVGIGASWVLPNMLLKERDKGILGILGSAAAGAIAGTVANMLNPAAGREVTKGALVGVLLKTLAVVRGRSVPTSLFEPKGLALKSLAAKASAEGQAGLADYLTLTGMDQIPASLIEGIDQADDEEMEGIADYLTTTAPVSSAVQATLSGVGSFGGENF